MRVRLPYDGSISTTELVRRLAALPAETKPGPRP
jgi:hypothetical protein